jgi:hypothetical protein
MHVTALIEYRRALAALHGEMDLLLAPAGLRVDAVQPEGAGWVLRVSGNDAEAPAGGAGAGSASGVTGAVDRTVGIARAVRAAGALSRAGDETLMEMLGRAGAHLTLGRLRGEGGLRAAAPDGSERLAWLAATLVGDTVLAVRHGGGAEDGDGVMEELQRQLAVFRRESRRVSGAEDSAPFLAAVDAWMPAGFPRGTAFLAHAGVADA